MAYQMLRLSDLMVVNTRNATFNEKVFPAVGNKQTSPLWHIEGENTGIKYYDLHTEPFKNSLFGNPQMVDSKHSNFLEEPAAEPDTGSSSQWLFGTI
ncbi:hypothetical protein O181_046305 [Austropuccinia psidii MF-1]|uniref:Uncharacterized protein n=1 Tax=Austropuccinia psidii MF-1 TaxID=1389203 RepID=A0A9Q3HM20_9BASI|nr:hypothetical protein [Austropuccinia psidii MF-1]